MVDVSKLPWLPEAPPDFRTTCKSLSSDEAELGFRLRHFAAMRLESDQLMALEAALRRCKGQGARDLFPLLPVALVSNTTTSFIARGITATGLRYGFDIGVTETPYGQIFQEVLDPASSLYKSRPQVVLLALDHRAFDLKQDLAGDASAKIDQALKQVLALSDAVHHNSDATVICQTLAPPPTAAFGHLDRNVAGTEQHAIEAFNARLRSALAQRSDVLFDVAATAALVGTARWHDPVMWNMAKLPFASEFVPLYADHLCRLLAALKGKSRKCLVLDLDNTLWGGAIGDDGLEGIVLGQGNPLGEAFLDVQQVALNLRDRGIVLAVCSKNEEENARLPFQKHPDMLLREDHIAAFIANWQDKSNNLEAIAQTLNLGVDSLVFLDDNPSERAAVRARLPMVAVPELPADPAQYTLMLLQAGYFEATSFVAEDRDRAGFYEANAKRAQSMQRSGDVAEYLASLNMELTLQPFDIIGRARIAQLINKTNQFNLTTRRYTEEQVKAMESDRALFTVQARLKDSFGDSGMISVVICRKDGARWWIDTWLMSCRVLGRKIEDALLQHLVAAARRDGATTLVGEYIPTPKNKMVEDHYAKLGFVRDGNTWRLDIGAYTAKDLPLKVTQG